MCILLIILLVLDVVWHIKDRLEIRRLNKNWDELFETKVDSDFRWNELCHHCLEKITSLCLENEKLKEELKCNTPHKKKKS